MKQNQLSVQEIDQLFDFVISKNVPYQDVQHEIVDHLASAIEELQANKPTMSFDQALTEIYGQFPITGFAVLQLEKEKAVTSYWRKRLWSYLISYITLPKIILTILLTILIYNILIRLEPLSIIIISVLMIGVIEVLRRNKFAISKSLSEKFLVIKTYHDTIHIIIGCVLIIPFFTVYDFFFIGEGDFSEILFSNKILAVSFALFFIFMHATLYIFPGMLVDELEQKYTHNKIA